MSFHKKIKIQFQLVCILNRKYFLLDGLVLQVNVHEGAWYARVDFFFDMFLLGLGLHIFCSFNQPDYKEKAQFLFSPLHICKVEHLLCL